MKGATALLATLAVGMTGCAGSVVDGVLPTRRNAPPRATGGPEQRTVEFDLAASEDGTYTLRHPSLQGAPRQESASPVSMFMDAGRQLLGAGARTMTDAVDPILKVSDYPVIDGLEARFERTRPADLEAGHAVVAEALAHARQEAARIGRAAWIEYSGEPVYYGCGWIVRVHKNTGEKSKEGYHVYRHLLVVRCMGPLGPTEYANIRREFYLPADVAVDGWPKKLAIETSGQVVVEGPGNGRLRLRDERTGREELARLGPNASAH